MSPLRPGFFLAPGMRVGLYGGSFDPAHEGHRHVADAAQRALGLHKVIWLVSPQNPLKPASSGLDKRIDSARRLAGRGMDVSAVEQALDSSYTADTVGWFRRRYPGVSFVFVIGSDSLAGFHRWKRWRSIPRQMRIAVVDRPGHLTRARLSPAGRAINPIYVHAPLNGASSTALRARAKG